MLLCGLLLFFFHAPATTELYPLSLHDALPISLNQSYGFWPTPTSSFTDGKKPALPLNQPRSEEHTSELQSPYDLVCRLLLEKKKKHRGRPDLRAVRQRRDVPVRSAGRGFLPRR